MEKQPARPHAPNGDFISADPEKNKEPPGLPARTDFPVTETEFSKPLPPAAEVQGEVPPYESTTPPDEVLTPKKLLKKRFARAVFAGANQTEGAQIAGGWEKNVAAQRGSELMRDPYVQGELRALTKVMEDKGLGMTRALDELDRGLKEAKLGSHADYLDKQLKMLGALRDRNEGSNKQPPLQLFQALVIEAERRGKTI